MKQLKIAIVGATGLVGRTFLAVLEQYGMVAHKYTLFSSARSAGTKVSFAQKEYTVQELTQNSFDSGFDIALFSAGGSVSEQFAPLASCRGCVVIDNSSHWRMKPGVPLVVPEVNPEDIVLHKGIIANPNCSTIQAVVALSPLHRRYGIKRIVYSTYQSVSGAGQLGCDDLAAGTRAYLDGEDAVLQKFPYPIFSNCIPHIDAFLENGYTKEEQKMIEETRKILHDSNIAITATTVRVPVFFSHSECINVELKSSFDPDDLREVLRAAPGIEITDDPSRGLYPMPWFAAGSDKVFVGRIRRDYSVKNGVNLWVVSDNVRKGAATNAVQIAQILSRSL